MAKIAIVFEYEPNPEHYPDCETVEECIDFDINGLNDGEIDPAELLGIYEWTARKE